MKGRHRSHSQSGRYYLASYPRQNSNTFLQIKAKKLSIFGRGSQNFTILAIALQVLMELLVCYNAQAACIVGVPIDLLDLGSLLLWLFANRLIHLEKHSSKMCFTQFCGNIFHNRISTKLVTACNESLGLIVRHTK